MKTSFSSVLMLTLLFSACGPSEKESQKKKIRLAEEKRVHCLDHYCEGDIDPKHDPSSEFTFKINGQWFVAPKVYGGLPPVDTCYHDRADGGGGTGFLWQPGIWAGIRMNQKHCADWPEIYFEIDRVLAQARRIQI